MIKILVFGVFDHLHPGHQFFLKEAKKLGDFLAVVLAKDEVVKKIKNKTPRQSFGERKTLLGKEPSVNEIIPGDAELESWKVFEKHRPDFVALGYDQKELKKSLEAYFAKVGWRPKVKVIGAFEPEKHKSSLIE